MANNTTNAESTGLKRGKQNGYNSAKLNAKRDRKRKDAELRQFEHDKLSVRQKLDLALNVNRRGESKREVSRLQAILAKQKAASNPPQVKAAPLTDAERAVKTVQHVQALVAALPTPKAKRKAASKKPKKVVSE